MGPLGSAEGRQGPGTRSGWGLEWLLPRDPHSEPSRDPSRLSCFKSGLFPLHCILFCLLAGNSNSEPYTGLSREKPCEHICKSHANRLLALSILASWKGHHSEASSTGPESQPGPCETLSKCLTLTLFPCLQNRASVITVQPITGPHFIHSFLIYLLRTFQAPVLS